jgi:hypothetical protein
VRIYVRVITAPFGKKGVVSLKTRFQGLYTASGSGLPFAVCPTIQLHASFNRFLKR